MWNYKKSRLETERIELIEFFKKNLKFLIDDFDFSQSLEKEFDKYPGGAKYYYLKYTNYQRQRQIEIIIHRNSDYRLWTIKKLKGSMIPDFYDNENIVSITDLDLMADPNTFNHIKHAVYTEEEKRKYVLEMIELLKIHWVKLIEGSYWIDRATIDKISLDKWQVKSGFRKDKLLEKIKTEFKFLENYGYKIIYDTNLLPPHKQSPTCEVIYSNFNKNDNYAILNDYKDYGFQIDHFINNRLEGEMINQVLTENQDKDWKFVTRMANWLESNLEKYGG
jgi:hypothetical protein